MPRHPAAVLTSLLAAFLTAPADDDLDRLARAALPALDGRVRVPGLRDSVEIVRDRFGVPHLYATNLEDLFFAQGYVQAQDRLWQMDVYRRTWTGELAEILGPSWVEHDRLARLLRYRGPWDEREWGSYHPEGRRIFDAFAAGINAYVAQLGDQLPVEFKLTGLMPGRWTPELSVLRTQTALPIEDARAELRLARSVAELGPEEANRRARPSPYRDPVVPADVDLTLVRNEVISALGGLRTGMPRPPLLPAYRGLADSMARGDGTPPDPPGSNNWVISGKLTASGRVLLANDPHRTVSNPSIRYIVHLNAPGWNVIGATEPPLPGVAIGHNGRIAWGLTIVGTDQSDVYVEEVHPSDRNLVRFRDAWEPLRIVIDTIRVRDATPVIVTIKYSRHGPIFYEDTAHHRAYAIRSTMHEPGSAGYLSALRYHALDDCRQFLDAQRYYQAPTENMICGDAHGNIAWQASAASPRRPNWHGRLPVPGSGEYEWDGFRDDLPREFNPERGWIATANHDIHPPGYEPPLFFKHGPQTARYDRIADLLRAGSRFTVADMQRMQHDAYNAAAARDLPLFRQWTADDPQLERARRLLADWDGWQRKESAAAALYSFVARSLPAEARAEGTPVERRRALAHAALTEGIARLHETLGTDPNQWRWGRINRSPPARALVGAYDIPAVERSGGTGTVAATGATYRQVVDFADLDHSMATNFPGQSGQPRSRYYANLAESFGREEYFPLAFTRAAVERVRAHRLVLIP